MPSPPNVDAAQALAAATALLKHLNKEAASQPKSLLDVEGSSTALYLTLNLSRLPARRSMKPVRM